MNNISLRPPVGTILYKYYPANTAKLVLTNGCVRFSPIIEFNDPFELNVYRNETFTPFDFGHAIANNVLEVFHSGEKLKGDGPLQSLIDAYRSGAIKDISEEDFAMDLGVAMAKKQFVKTPSEHTQVVMRRLAKIFGAFCISETYDNLLMWAHYAGSHTGAVIGIDPSKVGGAFDFIAPVKYSEKYPTSEDPFEAAATFLGRERKTQGEKIVTTWLFSKSQEWSYEREWRAIVNSNADFQSSSPDYSTLLIPLPPESIVSIRVGCRCSKPTALEIVDLAKKLNPEMQTMKGRTATDSYALKFIDFDQEWPNEYPSVDQVL